jgi:hypothetical protein
MEAGQRHQLVSEIEVALRAVVASSEVAVALRAVVASSEVAVGLKAFA